MRTPIAILAAAAATFAAAPLGAQGAFSVSVGGSDFDLAGTGTATIAALRLESTKYMYLVGEVGVVWFTYLAPPPEPGLPEARVIYVFPEASVQLQYPLGLFRPYIGGGVGWSAILQNGDGQELTLHVAGGARFVAGRWGVRAELRVRAVDPFHGSTTDVTVGIWRRL